MPTRRTKVAPMRAFYTLHVREVRERMNLTQSQVAKLTGLARFSIARYENGYFEPSLQTLIQIACGLGLDSIGDLVTFKRQEILRVIKEGPPVPTIEDPDLKKALQVQQQAQPA